MPTDALSYLLVGLILVPLYGAVAAALVGPREGNSARWIALHTTLITLALAVIVAWNFSASRLGAEPSPAAGRTGGSRASTSSRRPTRGMPSPRASSLPASGRLRRSASSLPRLRKLCERAGPD